MAGLAARLVWTRSDGTSVDFPLSKPVMLVGRDADADIALTEGLVSRNHARLEQRGEAWVVLDLGSTNLTRVNGEVVAERSLRHGDELRFARATCQFLLDAGPDVVAGGV